ncbi:amidohydrolase family protein [Nocardioides sp. YIM 152315]|uniref:N-acyl-D-amino-acid deacylase family protein n=1 Tax=Nocardioides sp. YIM 152315 TaxID=3031760 RepID=UPI0023DA8A15|nr:amidohydrolase family protein [Nocardioides sp. YIM 152315]MDF1604694.1 amidohydrolase family protein [Nocardioides sp. YIM 152315]
MAAPDLVVRGGTLVDGSGEPARTADVAITDGRVTEVGRVSGRGRQEVDADGAVVTPGFVDLHTHYDGQATWDSYLQPSSWHGVTTVVMGNCGVGFAPAIPRDHERLIALMEGVEDIPGVALTEGLAWDWESFPDYLDALERRSHDLDFAAQVPHAALRVRAMGERAAAHAQATDEEVATMGRLAAEAVRAGALGFTTSRTLNHKTRAGELTPSYAAGIAELAAISRAVGETGTGVLQLVTDWDDETIDTDFDLIATMARESGRPMSFSLAQSPAYPDRFRKALDFLVRANDDGLRLRAQVAARGIGILLGLDCTLNPFSGNPVWQELADLPIDEQARAMRDPETRRRILGIGVVKAANIIGGAFLDAFDLMFELGDPPDYEPDPDHTIARRAERAGVTPVELVYDLMTAGDGRGMLYLPFTNYVNGRLDGARDMLAHDFTVPGLSDGGAHVGTICDGSFPTTLLQFWARDRAEGRLPLEFVVSRQARATAEAVGLHDRGLLRPGYKGDLNVIDLERLHLHKPEMHHDLPAGGRRLLQRADGYLRTVVSGVVTYVDGVATGELPGRLVRGAQPEPAGIV